MKQVLIEKYGTPWEVARCAEVPDVGAPNADEGGFDVLAFPINPPTAQLMLSDFVDLKGGDWVIQNVANSAVGRLLIVLAHQRGLRTVNVVRRAELANELKQLGADLVMVDGDDLAARVARETG